MQRRRPRTAAQAPPAAEEKPAKEPAAPVKRSAKPAGSGYYRYVLDLHKSVSSKFKDDEEAPGGNSPDGEDT